MSKLLEEFPGVKDSLVFEAALISSGYKPNPGFVKEDVKKMDPDQARLQFLIVMFKLMKGLQAYFKIYLSSPGGNVSAMDKIKCFRGIISMDELKWAIDVVKETESRKNILDTKSYTRKKQNQFNQKKSPIRNVQSPPSPLLINNTPNETTSNETTSNETTSNETTSNETTFGSSSSSSSSDMNLQFKSDKDAEQLAKNVLTSVAWAVTKPDIPSSQEYMDLYDIKHPKFREAFEKEYKKTKKIIDPIKKEHPYDAQLVFWARMGRVLFTGSTVIIILVVLRKLFELAREFVYFVNGKISSLFAALASFFNPPEEIYSMQLLGYSKHKNVHSNRVKSNDEPGVFITGASNVFASFKSKMSNFSQSVRSSNNETNRSNVSDVPIYVVPSNSRNDLSASSNANLRTRVRRRRIEG